MAKRKSKGRASTGNSKESTPHISDNEPSPEPQSKKKKSAGPKTSSDLCQDFNLENVELEYTDADYQNLTTYNLFVRLIRPQIAAANPKFIPASKMNQLMEAKWREFNESNPFNKEKEEVDGDEDGDGDEEEEDKLESASNTEDYEKEQSSDDSVTKKRKSKGSSSKPEGSLKIKLPIFGVRKSAREKKPVKKLAEAEKFFDSDEDSPDIRRKRKAKKAVIESDDDFDSDESGPSRRKRRSGGRGSSAPSKRKKESSDEVSASSDSSSDLSSDSDGRGRRRGRNKLASKKDDRAVIPGERRSERSRKSNVSNTLQKDMTDREFEKMLKSEEGSKKSGLQKDNKKKKSIGGGSKSKSLKVSGKRGMWQDKDQLLSGEESDHCWYCALCNDGGDLMLCDGCPKSFHQKCLKLETVPEGEWKCPVCTGEGLPEFSDDRKLNVGEDEEEEEEEEGRHDHFCKECKQGGDLLLCDFCPCGYHMKCLNPPLMEIPEDDWKCPRCVALENPIKGTIQQVLMWKWVNVEQSKDDEIDHTTSPRKKSFQKDDEDSKDNTPKKRPERHMFVKYKFHSYWDCEWIPEIAYEMHAKQSWYHFKRKWDQDEPPALDDGGTVRHKKGVDPHNMDERFYQWGIKPQWLQIHRILTHERESSKLNKYLVKWRDLPYEECTWEAEDDLPEGIQDWEKQVDLYWSRRKEKEGTKKKDARKEKPKKKDLKKKLEKQPVYLDRCGGKLHPYQLEGLNWMRFSWAQDTNIILADEMGLGKTIQAISFLYTLWKEGYAPGPFIISAPLSTVANWEREFEFWAPEMYVVCYVGGKESRQIIREREFSFKDGCFHQTGSACRFRDGFPLKFDVLLTSYEMVSVDKPTLFSIPYSVLVIDEAHRLKSNQSLFFRVMNEYKIDYQLLLTGTPLQNNLEELFNLLHFLERKKFTDMQCFLEEFADISKDEQVKKLHDMLAPHMLRRLKMDVMKEIPDKCELIVRVELSAMQKKFYKHILTKNYSALNVRGHGNQTSLANIMMDLRKCCNHPYLFPTADQDATKTKRGLYEGSALIKAAGKLELLEKMLKVLQKQGHRVLLFSQMTRILDIVEDFMDYLGYKYERIDGSVTGTDRQTRIDRFNDPNSNSFVFLLSTKAGGLGINLATADTVIIYDMDWNPHNDIQALSRAHRIGQKNKVMIYRFVSRNTVEEKMTQVCKQKMMLSELVIAKGGGEKKDSLSKQEVNAILKFGAEDLFKDSDDGEVTYDMAAVEKLMDRTQAGEAEKALGMNEYLRSFNVATYQIKEGVVEEEEEPPEEEVELPPVVIATPTLEPKENDDPSYWQRVLGDSYTEHLIQLTKEQEEIARSLGKGKRMRKKINYAETALMDFIPQKDKKKMLHVEVLEEDEDNDDQYMSDYKPDDADSSSSDEEFDADGVVPDDLPEAEVAKKRKQMLKEQEVKKQQDKPKKDKGPETLPPLLAKVNGQIEVLGFTARQRRAFLDAVMRYGLPPEDGYRSQWLVRDLRMKTERVFKSYMSLFMRHLCEPIPEDAEKFADGVPREGLSRQHVLTRIGMIALLRRKVNEYENVNYTESMMEFSKAEQNNDKTEEQVYKTLLSHFTTKSRKSLENDDKKEQIDKDKSNPKTSDEKVKEKDNVVKNGETEVIEVSDKDNEKVNEVDKSTAKEEDAEKGGTKEGDGQKRGGEDCQENGVKSAESSPGKTKVEEEGSKEKEEGGSQETEEEGSKEKEEEGSKEKEEEGSKEKKEEGSKEKEDSKEKEEGSKENEEGSKEKEEGLKEKEEESKEDQSKVDTSDSAKTDRENAVNAAGNAENNVEDPSKLADKDSPTKRTKGSPKKSMDFTRFKPRTLAEIQSELRKRFWVSDGGFTELHAVWNHEESLLIPGREWEMWHRRHDYWLLTGVITHGYRHWQDIMNDPRFDIINKAFRSDSDRLKRAAFLNRRFQLLEQALVIEEQLRKAAVENVSHFKAAIEEVKTAQGKGAADDLLVQVDQFAANLRKISHGMKVTGPSPDPKVHKAISTLSGLITDIRQITYKTMPSTLAMTEHGAQSARQSMLARKLQQEAGEGKVITVE